MWIWEFLLFPNDDGGGPDDATRTIPMATFKLPFS
jgi:hypothetical protein